MVYNISANTIFQHRDTTRDQPQLPLQQLKSSSPASVRLQITAAPKTGSALTTPLAAAAVTAGVVEPQSESTRCRYKTGRCTNARVVKPNGSLLLLCEFHRSQQNRTKKRSDMKYRQDRAQKRLAERQQVEASATRPVKTFGSPSTSSCSTTGKTRKLSRARPSPVLERCHSSYERRSCPDSTMSVAATSPPVRSDRLRALAHVFELSECASERPRRLKQPRDAIDTFKRADSHSRSNCILQLELEDAEIAFGSPRVVSAADPECSVLDVTSSVLPGYASPLQTAHKCSESFWQPDDVRLLEYFIL